MITVRTSPAYVNRVRQDWTANGGVYGDGGVYAIVPSNDPFAQLGATLDLTFAGVPTDQLTAATADGYSINLNLSSDIYQIAAQYVVWQSGVGMASVNFSDIVTFTRASTATYFNSAGTLTSAAINEARFDYDPATLLARGFLIEEARTNSIRNNTGVGAVAGTPGTLPTNWTGATTISGLTREIVGTGAENGITYVDIRYFGTTTGALNNSGLVSLDAVNQIAASLGQAWTHAVYLKVAAGSMSGVTSFNVRISETDGVTVLSNGNTATVPTTASLATQRYLHTRTTVSAGVTNVQPAISITAPTSTAIDITLRIGLPQLELGAFATSVIPTTTTALTRSADVASVNTLSPWYSATEGTIYFEAQFYNAPNVAGSNMGALSDGTNSNRVTLGAATTFSGNINSNVSSGGVGQANPYVGSLSTVGPHKAAATYANNSFNIAVNGTLGVEDTSGVVPVGVNTLVLGRAANGAGATNGWLRRATYYPRRLSDADLQTITI